MVIIRTAVTRFTEPNRSLRYCSIAPAREELRHGRVGLELTPGRVAEIGG